MKLGIYTNITERCGNAEYARHLRQHLVPLYGNDISFSDNFTHLVDRDVVIINWHSSVAPFFLPDAEKIKARGAKIVLIHQNSMEYDITRTGDQVLSLCDAIIAHEPMGPEVHYIPHGIPIVLGLSDPKEPKVGTAGFPFPWKRFDVVVEVAKKFNIKCCMIAPKSDILATDVLVQGYVGHIPELMELERRWLSIEEVIGMLAMCTLNIFWFNNYDTTDALGQTGSARMGIAARRPVIISRHRKFRTLFDYEDELYIADTEQQVYEYTKEILDNPDKVKRPQRILQDMGWPTVALKYKEVIDNL